MWVRELTLPSTVTPNKNKIFHGEPQSRGRAMTENPKRHCWECRRRCLVCDSAKPACNRCTAGGTLCPGYGPVKPRRLTWLAPGKVKSRSRQRKGSSYAQLNEVAVHGQSTLPDLPDNPRSARVTHPLASSIPIPRFAINTDIDALVQAAAYCKFLSDHTMQIPLLTGPWQIMSASSRISSPCKSLETTHTYIRYHLHSSKGHMRIPNTCGLGCSA